MRPHVPCQQQQAGRQADRRTKPFHNCGRVRATVQTDPKQNKSKKKEKRKNEVTKLNVICIACKQTTNKLRLVSAKRQALSGPDGPFPQLPFLTVLAKPPHMLMQNKHFPTWYPTLAEASVDSNMQMTTSDSWQDLICL
jgi:hypothetical protein